MDYLFYFVIKIFENFKFIKYENNINKEYINKEYINEIHVNK
jgi:hypothetical protein